MQQYFPHWLLVGTQADRVVSCQGCQLAAVPSQGAIRCPACSKPVIANGLCWVGHLPALARPEPRFTHQRSRLVEAGFNEITAGRQDFLLIPLTIIYPGEWPNVEPVVRYARRWLDAAGLPRYSASHHLIGTGQACLYAYGEWHCQPVHSVLQQRVVNHTASLLKIMAGIVPHEAFIGKAHR
jgi:hypothetical protein